MIYPKIPVLLYHSIEKDNFQNRISIFDFEKQISFLKKNKYISIYTNEINEKLKNQIILTFDDGYKDIITDVLPILKKYNFKAICFIVSNQIGKNNIWDQNQKNYNKKELMNKNDINEWLKNGMLIGSHTQNHADLTKLEGIKLKNEIENSKKFLEETFATQVKDFCYPYGKVNNNAYVEVKKTYNNAYTTNRSRYSLDKHDPFLIPRVDMGKKLNNFKIFLKLKTFYEDIKFLKNEI